MHSFIYRSANLLCDKLNNSGSNESKVKQNKHAAIIITMLYLKIFSRKVAAMAAKFKNEYYSPKGGVVTDNDCYHFDYPMGFCRQPYWTAGQNQSEKGMERDFRKRISR